MPLTHQPFLVLLYTLLWMTTDTWLLKFPRRCLDIYREANRCADFLARIGILLENDFISFSNPPVDLVSILEADANGLYVNRFCSDPLFVG